MYHLFDRQKIGFEPKWYIPLIDLTLDDKAYVDGTLLSRTFWFLEHYL